MEAKTNLENFVSKATNADLNNVHHRVVDPDSLIAGVDMHHQLKELWDAARPGSATEGQLNQVKQITETLSELADNGINYVPVDEDRRKTMEFHDSYLGDRLKEAFAQELGQQYVPDLDALTSNPGNMDVLMKFSTEIPGADTKRLISSLSSHYASHAANDPTFERLKAVAAEKIAIAMVNHLS